MDVSAIFWSSPPPLPHATPHKRPFLYPMAVPEAPALPGGRQPALSARRRRRSLQQGGTEGGMDGRTDEPAVGRLRGSEMFGGSVSGASRSRLQWVRLGGGNRRDGAADVAGLICIFVQVSVKIGVGFASPLPGEALSPVPCVPPGCPRRW